MITTILVPINGSALSERVVAYAAALAQQAVQARVVLLHVPSPFDESTGVDAVLDRAVAELQARHLVVERVVDPEGATTLEGVAQAILRTAERKRAGLIAMSTHGRGGLGRWIYGSVADLVLRHSPVPVLLVSPHCEPSWPTKQLTRLLVPLDGSSLAEQGLQSAAALAEQSGAELVLLGVVDLTHYGGVDTYAPINPEIEVAGVREYLEACAAPLREKGRIVTTAAEIGFTVSTIAAAARQRAADLIVMATHGRGGVARVVLGSVATGVLQQADVPLLLVRPAALATSTANAASASESVPL